MNQYPRPITPPSLLSSPTPAECDHDIKEKSPMPPSFITHSSSSATTPVCLAKFEVDLNNTTTTVDFPSSSLATSSFSTLFLSSTQELAEEPVAPQRLIKHNHSASANTRRSSLEQNQSNQSTSNQAFDPIIEILREQELRRHVLVLAIPMAVGLFSIYKLVTVPLALQLVAVALSLGFVGIWNGILLRRTCHEMSNVIELLGIAFMLLAFFGFIAFILPKKLIWIPLLSWVLSLVVFAITICFRGRANRNREATNAPSNRLASARPPV